MTRPSFLGRTVFGLLGALAPSACSASSVPPGVRQPAWARSAARGRPGKRASPEVGSSSKRKLFHSPAARHSSRPGASPSPVSPDRPSSRPRWRVCGALTVALAPVGPGGSICSSSSLRRVS